MRTSTCASCEPLVFFAHTACLNCGAEQMGTKMGEPYRTLLGHFRHEVDHFASGLLAPEGSPQVEGCLPVGDDREDDGTALERRYADGPPADWSSRFVSAYATMHPYEDRAETWAPSLHVRDTAQAAVAYGVRVAGPSPPRGRGAGVPALAFLPRERPQGLRELLADWLSPTYALNALDRSMGSGDPPPLVLAEPVIAKLELIDELVLAGVPDRAAA